MIGIEWAKPPIPAVGWNLLKDSNNLKEDKRDSSIIKNNERDVLKVEEPTNFMNQRTLENCQI